MPLLTTSPLYMRLGFKKFIAMYLKPVDAMIIKAIISRWHHN